MDFYLIVSNFLMMVHDMTSRWLLMWCSYSWIRNWSWYLGLRDLISVVVVVHVYSVQCCWARSTSSLRETEHCTGVLVPAIIASIWIQCVSWLLMLLLDILKNLWSPLTDWEIKSTFSHTWHASTPQQHTTACIVHTLCWWSRIHPYISVLINWNIPESEDIFFFRMVEDMRDVLVVYDDVDDGVHVYRCGCGTYDQSWAVEFWHHNSQHLSTTLVTQWSTHYCHQMFY